MWSCSVRLGPLNAAVDRFFDDVMVMVEDEAVRANRLALLSAVERIYRLMGDWTRVVVA
jgi:glycyl-tRNA synthetase beta chain